MHVGIFIFDDFTALDVVGPYELLRRLPDTRISFLAKERGLKTAGGGLAVMADHAIGDVDALDILLISGGGMGIRKVGADESVLSWVRKIHERTAWTTSVCSGSLVLGKAGLLDGLDATSHWRVMKALPAFGARPVQRRVVHTGKIVTAAGVSAGIDMALYLTEQIFGRDMAQAVQIATEYIPQPHIKPITASEASENVRTLLTDM